MGLVDHQPGAVLLLQRDQPRQVGDVAVHGIQALDDDERALVEMAVLAQQLLQRVEVVVAEGSSLSRATAWLPTSTLLWDSSS